jgi:hypothetical protein
MTLESDGSAQAGAPANSQPNAENGTAALGSEQSPFAGLQDEGARAWVEKKGYKTVEDAVKAAHSLEGRLGASVTVPGADAKAEDWEKFYAKVGRPEKPDLYEFKRPSDLPKDLPYDEALAGKAKVWAHKAGLNPQQAQVFHDEWVRDQTAQVQAHLTEVTKQVETAHASLVKEWGPEQSEGFKTKHEMANRAIKKLGLIDGFKKSGLVLPDGALTDPAIAIAFSTVGEQMFAEDRIDGESTPGGPNPFEGEPNLTAIKALHDRDPKLAREKARQAGKNPDEWLGRLRT